MIKIMIAKCNNVIFIGWLCLLLLRTAASAVAETNAEGLQFLEENKHQPDVVTLPSGLQYKVLHKGSGDAHPMLNTPCRCHHAGRLIDGTIFDSSYDRGDPTIFAPDQVIPGWTEALQLMVKGDKWDLFLPAELAYGENFPTPPNVPEGSVLIVTLEIMDVIGDSSNTIPACDVRTREKCKDQENSYLDKVSAWTASKRSTELDRLENLLRRDESQMKPVSAHWMRQRVNLLEQILKSSSVPELVNDAPTMTENEGDEILSSL